ncbi:hypothetical protein [Pseudophaeobacter sp.]|uniref:hypothetical protein n=1 Tax=Pseudophaeobacter sp. TaxID=1971739 RepID=UPI003296DD94
MRQALTELANKIRSEFEVSPPPCAPVWLEVGSEAWTDTQESWGRSWSEIELRSFEDHMECFAFLGTSNFNHSFGALLFHSLLSEEFDVSTLDLLTTGLSGLSNPWSDKSLSSIGEKLMADLKSGMSLEQVLLIEEYFDYRAEYICEADNVYGLGFGHSLKQ